MYSIKNIKLVLTVNSAHVNIDCQMNKVKNLIIPSVSVIYKTLTLYTVCLSGVVHQDSSQPNVRIWFLDRDPVTEERLVLTTVTF